MPSLKSGTLFKKMNNGKSYLLFLTPKIRSGRLYDDGEAQVYFEIVTVWGSPKSSKRIVVCHKTLLGGTIIMRRTVCRTD